MDNKNNQLKRDKSWMRPALSMFARLNALVVIPVIIAIILGKWLDKKYGTEPWLLFATATIAFIFTMIALARRTQVEFKKLDESANNKQDERE